jgi:hypothetical protein
VGVGVVDITPYQFETHPVKPGEEESYQWGSAYFDTGVDGLFDFEEKGAFGRDGKPGRAGIDDDGDGLIDNCDRSKCDEYMAPGSDDVADPAGDNFDVTRNPTGTEHNNRFDFVHMGGFSPFYGIISRNRLAQKMLTPIWSRALAFKKGDHKIILISTDLPGLTWKHTNPVRRRLEAVFHVPVENIVITSTHDHAAPDAAGFWATLIGDHNKWYTDQLKEWMFQSAAQALMNLQPALMRSITTEPVSCYDPKTFELKRGTAYHLPDSNTEYAAHPELYDAWLLQRDMRDPIVRNTRIVAAQFVSLASRQTIATLINWSDHPDTLGSGNMLISSDFPGFVRDFVEAKLGGRAVYFSGTVGCQIGALRDLPIPLWTAEMAPVFDETKTQPNGAPFPKLVTGGIEKTRSIGFEVGSTVVNALSQEARWQAGDLPFWIRTEPVDIQVNNFLHVIATGSVWHTGVEPPDRLRFDSERCTNILGCVRTDVSVLQIGDVGFVTSPGEMDPAYLLGRHSSFSDFGGKWGKKDFPAMPGFDAYIPGKHHVLLGQANNYLSYLVHLPDNVGPLNFNHPLWYEEFLTVSKHFGDDAGNKIMQLLGRSERYSDREVMPRRTVSKSLNQSPLFSSTKESGDGVIPSPLSSFLIPSLLKRLEKPY